jgi:hypothetical protein
MDDELYHWPLRKQPVFAAVAGLLFVPLAIVAAYRLTPPLARLDDAYIALHSARVVLSGHDPIFGVPALVGATSPAYVALLTGILAAGVTDGDTVLRLANALGIVAFAWSVWYLAGVEKLSLVRRVALVIVALGSGVIIPFNLTNGLETGWAIATLTFAIAAARAGWIVPVGFAVGLLPFLRPDLAPASAVVLLYAIRGRPRREQLTAVCAAVTAAVPWLLWTRIDTGTWIAQTFRAKQLFHAEGCRPPIEKAVTVLRGVGVGLAQMFPLSLGLLVLGRDKLGRLGLAAMAVAGIAYFIAFPGAIGQPFLRYLTAICVPWLCLGLALGLARVSSVAGASLAIAVIVMQVPLTHDQNAAVSEEVKAAAEWVDVHVSPGAIVLVHDAGAISEFAHHPAIDLVGLKTPSSIAAHARWTWPSCVAERGIAVSAIAERSGATYFVAASGWDEYLSPPLIASGFVLTPVRLHPPGRFGYTVYRMERKPRAAVR